MRDSEFYKNINNILTNEIQKILDSYLEDGLLFVDAIYTPETQDLKFIFEKVGE